MNGGLTVLAFFLAVSCGEVGAPSPAADSKASIFARGVVIEVPLGGGQLVVRADRLELDEQNQQALLDGHASVEVAPLQVEAEGQSLRLRLDRPVVEMWGGVRARFRAPKSDLP